MAQNCIEINSTAFNEEIKKIRTNLRFSAIDEDVSVILLLQYQKKVNH